MVIKRFFLFFYIGKNMEQFFIYKVYYALLQSTMYSVLFNIIFRPNNKYYFNKEIIIFNFVNKNAIINDIINNALIMYIFCYIIKTFILIIQKNKYDKKFNQ